MHQDCYRPHMHINLENTALHYNLYHIGTRVFVETPRPMSEESIKGLCNVARFEEFTMIFEVEPFLSHLSI